MMKTAFTASAFLFSAPLALVACGERGGSSVEAVELSGVDLERARTIAAAQAEGALDTRYQLASTRGRVRGANVTHGLELSFSEDGAELAPVGEPWRLSLRATGLDCGTHTVGLDPVEPAVGSEQHRVEYRRQNLTEWYVNGALGLEQGFTIAAPPCGARSTFGVTVELDGLEPEHDGPERGGELALLDASGDRVAYYSDWFALDAAGKPLPLALHVGQSGVRLEVEAAGAEWPVVVDPLVWVRQQKLFADDGAGDDRFGRAVSLSNGTALVGAHGDDDRGSYSGSAYVFTWTGATWAQQQKLTASDGGLNDFFGFVVSVSEDTALVGAYGDGGADAGSAYVFTRSGTEWSEQQKLTASDGGGSDNFGIAVSVSGDKALVGAWRDGGEGSAYVFTRSGTEWSEQQKLTASDGAAADDFGHAVAVVGDTALVGASGDDGFRGSAYVFTRSGTEWSEQQKLTASDRTAGDLFGYSVALSGDTAIVGARGTIGAAYVFTRSGTEWSEQQKLTASDGAEADRFGSSVALSGDRALIGAPEDDDRGSDSGSAYVFTRSGTEWSQQQKLRATLGSSSNFVGASVALSMAGDLALVGALGDRTLGVLAGSAYVFGFGLGNGEACTQGSECGSLRCVEGVCCNQACEGCRSCLAANKASGADGFCGDVVVGTDPRDACAAQGGITCGTTGVCDGAGACVLHSAGTDCASACPTATSEALSASCDGAGACAVSEAAPCALGYLCVDGACKTSCQLDADCDTASGFECIAGECKIPPGATCTDSADCASGHCVDGVCCESACEGQCQSCAEGGNEGSCVIVEGAPRPGRPTCEETGDEGCGSRCDGEHAECRFVPAGKSCGTTCEDGVKTQHGCDGEGRCLADEPSDCAPYACGQTECLTGCTTDEDCAPGARCESGECLAQAKVPGAAGGSGTESPDAVDVGVVSDSGCGCRAAGSGPLPSSAALALLVAGLGAAGRRRRRVAAAR